MCDPLKAYVEHNPDNLVSLYTQGVVRRTGIFVSYEDTVRLLRNPYTYQKVQPTSDRC